MSYRLWARGAVLRNRNLMVRGRPRGIEVRADGLIEHATIDGSRHSAFVPSPSGLQVFVLEWDEESNIAYVIESERIGSRQSQPQSQDPSEPGDEEERDETAIETESPET